jgi:hypothetical protein
LALSDTQMDGVTAGAAALANAAAQAIGEFDAVTHTETLTNTNIATTPHFALAATLAQAAAASVLTISQSTANTKEALQKQSAKDRDIMRRGVNSCAMVGGDETADTGDSGVRTLRQDDAAGGVSR